MKELAIKQKNVKEKNGFTLVELIVVLVILAVLAAILLPTFLGFIDKARRQQYLVDCRGLVMAAQAIASEDYGMGTFNAEEFLQDNKDEIFTLADLEQSGVRAIRDVGFSETLEGKLTKLVYRPVSGMSVTYDADADEVYKFGYDIGAVGAQPQWAEVISELKANQSYVNTSHLREEILKQYGSFPALLSTEKYMLHTDMDGIVNLKKETLDSLVWKPVESNDGFAMIANGTETVSNNINAYMVYYNGSYYACLNKTYAGVTFDYNAASKESIATLADAKPLSYYETNPSLITSKTWVRLD